MSRRRVLSACAIACVLPACFSRTATPWAASQDALGGHAPRRFDAAIACGRWEEAVGAEDDAALSHVSYPERDPRGCFVPVRYLASGVRADPVPEGCGYPRGPATEGRLRAASERYRAIAAGTDSGPLPLELACDLPADVRAQVALHNARTLERLARRVASGRRYPYAAASTFGFGHALQGTTRLVTWRPGDGCTGLEPWDRLVFGANIVRAHRAAEAHFAGVAPVVTFSGGAVHSRLYEAFMLAYVATCKLGVRPDAVLLDPCAAHTHENLRNTGALLVTLGARTGYAVTDDGLQADYLQDSTLFSLIGGSIDQRSLRDFGYLVGSYRQASVGNAAGFWFTPYRFWADPEQGLGGFTCMRR